MWDNLRKEAAFERQQLRRLLEGYGTLLAKCAETPPNPVELSALAAMLHSFYNGIENIFKRIADEIDGRIPSGEFWHRGLLETMTQPNKMRTAAVSEPLAERLGEYMEFRHVFRHAYTFDLNWDKMRPLVEGCQDTLTAFEAELDSFLQAGPRPSP